LRWKSVYTNRIARRLVPDWHTRGTLALARRLSEWRRGCRYANFDRGLARLKNRPVFLIRGSRDSYAPKAITEDMASRIGPAAQIWEVAGAKHNRARQVDEREYDRQLVAFFRGQAAIAKDLPKGEEETVFDSSLPSRPSPGTSLPI
jgi:pimeloyl-ACP methyl ester carboxylesterase